MADSISFSFGSTPVTEFTSFNPGSFKQKPYRSPIVKRYHRPSKNCNSAILATTMSPSITSSNNNKSTTNSSVCNIGASENQPSTPSTVIVNPFTAQDSATAPIFSISTGESAKNFVFDHVSSSGLVTEELEVKSGPKTKVKVVGFDHGESSRNGSQLNQQTQKDFVVEEPKGVNIGQMFVQLRSSYISSQMGLLCPVEINQNEATEEANQEPVSTSALPLTVISRILNGIPQNPHFYQLRNYSELVRKNLISSWDCTFEEIVKQLHSLQVVDFWIKASELWKTMGELQSLGYNVILLRRRLVELNDVMMELKMSQMEIKGLKIKAENHRMEKSRIESVILNFQAMAKREQDNMERVLVEVAKMKSDLPKFDGVFAKLALEPLS